MSGKRPRGRPVGSGKKFEPVPLPGLTHWRVHFGETRLTAGERIGVNASHMRKLELGTVRLDLARAKVLADAYSVPVEWFLTAPEGVGE